MTAKPSVLLFSALAALTLAFTVGPTTAQATSSLDDVPDLQLAYGDGDAAHSPGLAADGQLRVYWFWSAHSPCSKNAEPSIEALQNAHLDVEVIVVHSNADQSASDAEDAGEERDFSFAVYRDEGAQLAIALNATMTPEVVVVDDSQIIYRGRPISISRRGTQSFVEEAVVAWKSSAEPDTDSRRPTGCVIRRP